MNKRSTLFITLSLSLFLISFSVNAKKSGRYITYIDDQGVIRNITVDLSHIQLIENNSAFERRKRLVLSDFTEENKELATLIQQKAPLKPEEERRRYYTWVDPVGRVQNSFYADKSDLPEHGREYVLPTGDLASDFISSDVFEGKGYQNNDQESYYTWTDATGRVFNTYLTPEERSSVFTQSSRTTDTKYTNGNEIILNQYTEDDLASGKSLSIGKALSQVMNPNQNDQHLSAREKAFALAMASCCAGINQFSYLNADEPKFEEINQFSPTYKFPTGESHYAAFQLPVSQREFGLRVRSFADKNLFYPTLLFLDANKKPTRIVTHAIYRLIPENWHSHAFIEGIVKIKPYEREKYIVLFTTPNDLTEETLDHQPFPLNVSIKDKNEDFKVHEHTQIGSFEIAIIR